MLKGKTCELSPIVMDDLHGFRIPGKSGVLKVDSNMVTRLFENLCNFDKVGGGVDAGEGEEFHSTMWC